LARLAWPDALLVFHAHSHYFTFLDRRVVGRHLRDVDLVLCCSGFVASVGRAAFPDLAGRFATVYNGVDTSRFGSVPCLGSSRGTGLLFRGRMSPEKGVHVLTDTFARLALQDENI
jgi:glycosyltransferase involved in cell wall biosynthesis